MAWASAAMAIEPGDPAPACSLSRLGESAGVELRHYRGQVVLVDFWASWCTPCAHAFPFLDELERDFGSRGFAVLAVNLDEDPAEALAFAARHPTSFPLLADPLGDCPRAFGLWTMPSSYLIDAAGVVRVVRQGFTAVEARSLRERIEALVLAEHDPRKADAR